jgi:membrane-bound lytic murein transglycosylase MltF
MGQIDYEFKTQYNYKMDELFQRLDRAERAIATVKSKVARKDLLKMVRTIDTYIVAADQESVECRRVHKETLRYQELKQQTDDLLTNLEQHITFASLLG